MAPTKSPLRRTARLVVSTNGDAGQASVDRAMRVARRATSSTSKVRPRRAVKHNARSAKSTPSNSPSKLPQASYQTPSIAVPAKPVIMESDGIIPPWASLPYEILVEVFRYAALPLLDDTARPTASIRWLLQTARLCRSFAEPALTCIYQNPPLWSLDMPHRLLDLLRSDPGTLSLNYRTKVKRFELNSVQTLAYSCPGRGSFKLPDIIPLVPRLAAIDITNQLNQPPFRRVTGRGKWRYPDELFRSLQQTGICLNAWRWHGEMLSPGIASPEELHQTQPFSKLRLLTLSNLYLSTKEESSARRNKSSLSVTALSALGQLTELVFESCTSATWDILDNIPHDLNSLKVVNCPDFSTEHLSKYLEKHGRALRTLILNHNQSLNLTFLPWFAMSCPKLEVFNIDLTYFSASILGDFTHKSDAEPQYETLMHADEKPTWPTTLQEVKILHLRKLTAETATTFFKSLIKAAPALKYLRTLVIRAILDISWRERAGFRERWMGDIKEAFLRTPTAPDPNLASMKLFRIAQQQSQNQKHRHETLRGSNDRKSEGGPCDKVEVSIDNMRPTELRFTEDDFMDSEDMNDEDWTSNNGMDVDEAHAW